MSSHSVSSISEFGSPPGGGGAGGGRGGWGEGEAPPASVASAGGASASTATATATGPVKRRRSKKGAAQAGPPPDPADPVEARLQYLSNARARPADYLHQRFLVGFEAGTLWPYKANNLYHEYGLAVKLMTTVVGAGAAAAPTAAAGAGGDAPAQVRLWFFICMCTEGCRKNALEGRGEVEILRWWDTVRKAYTFKAHHVSNHLLQQHGAKTHVQERREERAADDALVSASLHKAAVDGRNPKHTSSLMYTYANYVRV